MFFLAHTVFVAFFASLPFQVKDWVREFFLSGLKIFPFVVN